MLEKPVPVTTGGEDRDVVGVIPLCCNNEIKAGLPVRPSPGLALALYLDDRGSGLFYLFFFEKVGVFQSLRQDGSMCRALHPISLQMLRVFSKSCNLHLFQILCC